MQSKCGSPSKRSPSAHGVTIRVATCRHNVAHEYHRLYMTPCVRKESHADIILCNINTYSPRCGKHAKTTTARRWTPNCRFELQKLCRGDARYALAQTKYIFVQFTVHATMTPSAPVVCVREIYEGQRFVGSTNTT